MNGAESHETLHQVCVLQKKMIEGHCAQVHRIAAQRLVSSLLA